MKTSSSSLLLLFGGFCMIFFSKSKNVSSSFLKACLTYSWKRMFESNIYNTNIRLESCCLQNYANIIIYFGSSPLLLLFCAKIPSTFKGEYFLPLNVLGNYQKAPFMLGKWTLHSCLCFFVHIRSKSMSLIFVYFPKSHVLGEFPRNPRHAVE